MTRKNEVTEEVKEAPIQLVTENQLINEKLNYIISLLETAKEQ
jgi:hypothetical protein